MKNILQFCMCLFLFFIIIAAGFLVVDKSFNSMMTSEESIKAISLDINENGYLEGELLNEPFRFNVDDIIKDIESLKKTITVYMEKLGNKNVKNII